MSKFWHDAAAADAADNARAMTIPRHFLVNSRAKNYRIIQKNFNGSNTFGTLEMCSRQG